MRAEIFVQCIAPHDPHQINVKSITINDTPDEFQTIEWTNDHGKRRWLTAIISHAKINENLWTHPAKLCLLHIQFHRHFELSHHIYWHVIFALTIISDLFSFGKKSECDWMEPQQRILCKVFLRFECSQRKKQRTVWQKKAHTPLDFNEMKCTRWLNKWQRKKCESSHNGKFDCGSFIHSFVLLHCIHKNWPVFLTIIVSFYMYIRLQFNSNWNALSVIVSFVLLLNFFIWHSHYSPLLEWKINDIFTHERIKIITFELKLCIANWIHCFYSSSTT